jgi:hypothetical protein
MATRRENWTAEHKEALERKVRVRIDSYHVEERPDGGFEVLIEGFGLYGVIVPPKVTVGEIPMEQLRFEKDGRAIRGVLRNKPAKPGVVVDYGFARAELKQ